MGRGILKDPNKENKRESFMSYAAKRIRHLVGKAIHTHQMITDGDHVLVAVSGGKDSLTLLWMLKERIARVPIDYQLTAVHVDPGFGRDSSGQMKDFFEKHGFRYRTISTDIGPRAHSEENRENPCFLCARLRRKRIFELAHELGCKKIAFGHHKDDIIETFFINVFYGASISTMVPVQSFFDGKITIIRPLYMVDEELIERYSRDMGWPVIDIGCPSAGKSKRQGIKSILQQLYRSNGKVKGNIFHALQNVRSEYLL